MDHGNVRKTGSCCRSWSQGQSIFPIDDENRSGLPTRSGSLSDVSSGAFDGLFPGSPHKPSDLYRSAHAVVPGPTIDLMGSTPFRPDVFTLPKYPAIARLARVEGNIVLKARINSKGVPADVVIENGPPLLQAA